MEITLIPYGNERETAADMLMQFWAEHDIFPPGFEEACEDLSAWTRDRHSLYLIHVDGEIAGFIHLICPAGNSNCRMESFLMPRYRGKGIDSVAVSLAEEILVSHFRAQYPDSGPENLKPQRIYQETGYSCPAALESRKTFRLGSHK